MLSKATQDEVPPQDTVTSWAPRSHRMGGGETQRKVPVRGGKRWRVSTTVEVVVGLWVEGGGPPKTDPQPAATSATPAVSRAR